MTCLLCGCEAEQMHQLMFSIQNREEFERQFPNADLDACLRDFGICFDCMRLSSGQRRRLIFSANQGALDEPKPPRILH